jgi:hypothetical protein
MRYSLQVVGYCGGWTRLGLDTEQELAQAIPDAFATRGLNVKSVDMTADEWDVTSRVFSNQFHYSATVGIDSNDPASVVTQAVQRAMTALTGIACTVANLTAGEASQNVPNSNPIPGILDAATMPVLVLTVLAVAVAYVVFKLD